MADADWLEIQLSGKRRVRAERGAKVDRGDAGGWARSGDSRDPPARKGTTGCEPPRQPATTYILSCTASRLAFFNGNAVTTMPFCRSTMRTFSNTTWRALVM